ncbi:MAG TPA: NADH-quinone oxidoreductase subunit NuoK [Tepidisphaeraceae bacterium]|jgi:NADH-quinone oxidoreductase subunit K
MIGIGHYLMLGGLLFVCGLGTVLLKRHAMGILMGVELMLNAANVNLVAFAHYGGGLGGQICAIFVVVIAAAEAAVALAIFLNFYNNYATIDVDRGSTLRG